MEISCFSSERDGFGTERWLGGEPNPEQCLCGRSQTQSAADWLKDSSPVSVPSEEEKEGSPLREDSAPFKFLFSSSFQGARTSCEYASCYVPPPRAGKTTDVKTDRTRQ